MGLRWAGGCLFRLPGGNLYGGKILFLEASEEMITGLLRSNAKTFRVRMSSCPGRD